MATKRASTTTRNKPATASDTQSTKKRSDLVCKTGNLGETPELRFTPTGKAVTNFSLAVNIGKGEDRTTEWYQVTAWEQLAENVVACIKKGDRVIVWGVPSVETYEKSDGTEGKQKKINAWVVGADLNFAIVAISKIERSTSSNNGSDYYEGEEPF